MCPTDKFGLFVRKSRDTGLSSAHICDTFTFQAASMTCSFSDWECSQLKKAFSCEYKYNELDFLDFFISDFPSFTDILFSKLKHQIYEELPRVLV